MSIRNSYLCILSGWLRSFPFSIVLRPGPLNAKSANIYISNIRITFLGSRSYLQLALTRKYLALILGTGLSERRPIHPQSPYFQSSIRHAFTPSTQIQPLSCRPTILSITILTSQSRNKGPLFKPSNSMTFQEYSTHAIHYSLAGRLVSLNWSDVILTPSPLFD